ncbi:DUF5302 domain-containing protein [Micrococcales bacterium 31B]|nr:DUF5302 domain-containing protein [Micrococcales bacterium 31B]
MTDHHAHGAPAPEDVKAKFKEALERKNQTKHEAHGDGASNTGAVHESAGGGGQRMFRRKSGG